MSKHIKAFVELYENKLTPEENDYYGKPRHNGRATNEDIADAIIEEGCEFQRESLIDILERASRKKREFLISGATIMDGFCHAKMTCKGRFQGSTAPFDKSKHSLGANIQADTQLKEELKKLEVKTQAATGYTPAIRQLIDITSGEINKGITPNNVIIVKGQNIRIAGEHPNVGIYFINTGTGEKLKSQNIITNKTSELILMVPDLPSGMYSLELVTQYTHGSCLLAEPRHIQFNTRLSVE